MKDASLGAKCLLSWGLMSQAVVPPTGLPASSVQSKAAPPQGWTSIPKCCLYQACRALASFALKKMPPMPVTRFMGPPVRDDGEKKGFFCGPTRSLPSWRCPANSTLDPDRMHAVDHGAPSPLHGIHF